MITSIVPGSLAAVAAASGLSLAESFLNCDVLVLIDQSGSMAAEDAPGRLSRYKAADNELKRLQGEHPGKVGVVSFSNTAEFCPGGVPNRAGGGTDMTAALRFAHVADGVCQIVLISDGVPNDEAGTLAQARRFQSAIHTIYIGPEGADGAAFLRRLSQATGGQSFKSAAPGLLAESVNQLLLA